MKTNMNKQQLLDKENPSIEEAAMQQLLIRGSKTSLEADKRTFNRINEALYKSNMKNLTFEQIYNCITTATQLAGGGEITPNINAVTKKTA